MANILEIEAINTRDELEHLSQTCVGNALTKQEAQSIVDDIEKQIAALETEIFELTGKEVDEDDTSLADAERELASLRVASNLYQQVVEKRTIQDVEKAYAIASAAVDEEIEASIKAEDKMVVPAEIAAATSTEAEKVAKKQLEAAQAAEQAAADKMAGAAKLKEEAQSELKHAEQDLEDAIKKLDSAEEVKDFNKQNNDEYKTALSDYIAADNDVESAKKWIAATKASERQAAKEKIEATTARYRAQDVVAKAKAAATSTGQQSKTVPLGSTEDAVAPAGGLSLNDGPRYGRGQDRPVGALEDVCSIDEPALYKRPSVIQSTDAQTTRDAIIDAINMGLSPTAIGAPAHYPNTIDIWSWGGHSSGKYCNSIYEERLLFTQNMKLDKIVLHDSDEATPALTINTLRKWSGGTHYTVDKAGLIRQHVPPVNSSDEIVKEGEGSRTIGSLKHASTDEYIAGVKKFSVRNGIVNDFESIAIDICNFVSLKGNRAESWIPADTYARVDVIENSGKAERTPAAEFALEDRQKANTNPFFLPRGSLKGLYLEGCHNSGKSGNKYGIEGHPAYRRRSPGSGQTGHVTGNDENFRFVQQRIQKDEASWYKNKKGKEYFLSHLKHQLEACYQLCLFLTTRDELPDLRLIFPAEADPNGFYWGTDPEMVKQIRIKFPTMALAGMTSKTQANANITYSKAGIISHARTQIGRTDGLLQEHYLLCRKNDYSVAAAFERTIIAATIASGTGNYTKMHLPGFETVGLNADQMSFVIHDPNKNLQHDGLSEGQSRNE